MYFFGFKCLCGQHKTSYARKSSIAVSEEDGRYKMIRYIATDFSMDSLTRDLQDPLQGKSAGRVLKALGVRDHWSGDLEEQALVSHTGICWEYSHGGVGGSGLFSGVKEGCFQ